MILPWRKAYPIPEKPVQLVSTSETDRELRALARLGATGKHGLEVGAAFGMSTIVLANAMPKRGMLLSIDPHNATNLWPGGTLEPWTANLKAYELQDKVSLYEAYSQAVLPALEDAEYDFAFIDGDHTFQGCWHDLNECWRLVKAGGKVALHDYHEDTCPGVTQAIERFCQERDLSFTLTDTLAVFER